MLTFNRFLKRYCAFILSGLMLICIGCVEDDGSPSGPSDGRRIKLNNDPNSLNGRVHIADDSTVVPLSGTGDGGPDGIIVRHTPGSVSAADEGGNVVLMLRAEIDPPVLNDQELRATHVDIVSGFAYVSYNVEGQPYMGGVEVFDVSNPTRPRIISQALFSGTDVSAVAYSNQRIYLAEATTDEGFATPAALEEIFLEGEELTDSSRRVDLPSYVATGVAVVDGGVYVTSGTGEEAEGGLTILSQQSLEVLVTDIFDDARDVDYNQSEVVVLQGTPGRLRIYNRESGDLVRTFESGGADIPESKSTIEVLHDRVYMAAGNEGMKVVSLTDGSIIDALDPVVLEDVDPELTVTNAVTVNEDLVLMANGEAGVYVAALSDDGMELLGFMNFESTSANYVKSQDNVIFVASGMGGLKILEAVYYDPEAGHFLTLGNWGRRGLPDYLLDEGDEISDEQMNEINEVFRERSDLTERREDFFDDENVTNVALDEDAEVFVSFVHESTGWRNALGFYTYPADNPPESTDDLEDMTVIFPNVSYRGGGGDLQRGNKVNLSMSIGSFSAGTVIGCFLVAQGWDGRYSAVTRGLYIHYSDLDLNDDVDEDLAQQQVLASDPDRELLILAFEDTRRDSWLCDNDFNEAIFIITSDPPDAINTEDLPVLSE